jgi:hypothetical protein
MFGLEGKYGRKREQKNEHNIHQQSGRIFCFLLQIA